MRFSGFRYALTKDASHTAAQSEAVYVNETPVVVDGGCSPTEARAPAAAASGGTAATTIITEVLAEFLSWIC